MAISELRFDGFRVDPLAMLFDEVDEVLVGFRLRDIVLNAVLSDVEIDFSWGTADVTEIGIGHFARAVYNTSHDGDFDAF